MTEAKPPVWTAEQLEDGRQKSLAIFKDQRLQEDPGEYVAVFDEFRGAVEDLLETTVDLSVLKTEAVTVTTNAPLLEALRYIAGPPVSADDLKVLADVDSLTASRLKKDPAMAQRIVETVLMALDRRRFPWVGDDRDPTDVERQAATLGSAALMATRFIETIRRNMAKLEQEDAVKNRLRDDGFEEVKRPKAIPNVHAAPGAGKFCGETTFGPRKADIIVGLWDGRTLPLECKVSNSYTNSVKRLNNDAAVKAVRWREVFGTGGVVPAAVLSGVYKRHNLEQAQDAGLTLFWAHDLDEMASFIESTKES